MKNRVLYVFWGKVIAGAKRGRKLGFPTANMHLHKSIPDGIYVSQTIIAGKKYTSATFIGKPEMFGETHLKAETYLLDFNQTIYGKWVTVQLYKKIRENKKFDSVDLLIIQMKRDIEQTKQYFALV